LVNYSLLTAK